MRIETIEQRAYRLQQIAAAQAVLAMHEHQQAALTRTIARLRREIEELEHD